MIQVGDLRPGDIIMSYKAAGKIDYIGKFFDWRVREYAKETLGSDCLFPEANHARVVAGVNDGLVWAFHWTSPTARFCKVEEWMVDPSYACVARLKGKFTGTSVLMNECLKYEGDTYNLGGLLDMDLGFKRFFSFGPNHYVCSTGVRVIHRDALGVEFPMPVTETPPCFWANRPEKYKILTYIQRGQVLRSEPAYHAI